MRHAKLGAKTYLSREPRLHGQYFEHKRTHKLVPNLAAAFRKVQVSYSSLTARFKSAIALLLRVHWSIKAE